VPLGRWVLTEACRQASAWRARHPEDRTTVFAVNVAPRQLADGALPRGATADTA